LFRTLQDRMQQSAAHVVTRLVQAPPEEALHIAAAVSLEEVLGQLLVDFTLQQPLLRVRGVYGGSDELADQILAGAPVDVFLSADPRQIERLRDAGLTAPKSRMVLAENGLAVAGLAAWSDIKIRKPADLRRAGAVTFAMARPSCPLGGYTAAWLDSERLTENVLPHRVLVDNSRAVVSALRSGQAQLGIVCSSDALQLEGCRVLFTVRRLPVPFRYEGVLLRGRQTLNAGRQFLQFLTTRTARARFRRCGFLLQSSR
jgi:molybdate transport system substrate-binding protein